MSTGNTTFVQFMKNYCRHILYVLKHNLCVCVCVCAGLDLQVWGRHGIKKM
jgi:hypothetical protein